MKRFSVLAAVLCLLLFPGVSFAASLVVSPGVTAVGRSVHVEWRDVTTNGNNHWIGMYANSTAGLLSYIEERTIPVCTGGPDMVAGDFYLQDAQNKGMTRNGSCAFNAPSTTGTTFEFRLIQGGTLLAVSPSFQVVAADTVRQISDYFPNPVQAQSHILVSAANQTIGGFGDVVVSGLLQGVHPTIVFGAASTSTFGPGDIFFWDNNGVHQLGDGITVLNQQDLTIQLTPRHVNLSQLPPSRTLKHHPKAVNSQAECLTIFNAIWSATEGCRDFDITTTWESGPGGHLLTHRVFGGPPNQSADFAEVFAVSDNVPICGTATGRKGLSLFEHWELFYYPGGVRTAVNQTVCEGGPAPPAWNWPPSTWFPGVGCRTAVTADYCWKPRYR